MSIDAMSAGTVSMQSIDLSNMDIETALMMVQSQRADLLESQLKSQIEEVKNRNDQVSKLNAAVAAAQKLYSQADKKGDCGGNSTLNTEVNNALQAAGVDAEFTINPIGWAGAAPFGGTMPGMSPQQTPIKITSWTHLAGGSKRENVDSMISKLKNQIDGLNNSNQMDMLRLQSLTNKRNEAYDVMSNFIKKMQDSRSSIIGNMR